MEPLDEATNMRNRYDWQYEQSNDKDETRYLFEKSLLNQATFEDAVYAVENFHLGVSGAQDLDKMEKDLEDVATLFGKTIDDAYEIFI